MFARGVDVDEIMREARPADEARRAFVGDEGRGAAVALREMQGVAGPPCAPLARRYQRIAAPDQGVEQSRDRAAARARDVVSAGRGRQSERVDQ